MYKHGDGRPFLNEKNSSECHGDDINMFEFIPIT